ncbi:hypothetical protein KIW84_020708 [Lathyrus oleraceus]|uniref:Ethylene insensitive 3-like DNA-binding domain-containing protein n=1 Tax=Pisum sativum TaxID=3888 RepID=A0A9D5B2Z1_PEA|nr:hypothetical protein KIW84_020708 [Pisum sativum]
MCLMMFDDTRFCGTLRQTVPDTVVDDDYSDEEIDIDELERRMWRDKMRLKRLREQTKAKEGSDAAKERQFQEQARMKKMARAQEQARVKKMYGIFKYKPTLKKKFVILQY